MLDCKRNRLDYGELLRPPEGYYFEQAVVTTYSADLGTLLSLPIALLFSQTLEGDFSETRFQLLDAIKRFAQKASIYHQKGQLHIPAKLSFLHAFLEDALVDILPDNAFTAFHPKVWITKYVSKEDDSAIFFRVLVLSRNLTFDRSWDVAACIEGEPGEKEREINRPLIDFIRYLDEKSAIPNVKSLIDELKRTNFQVESPFESFRFCPSGIPGYDGSKYFPKSADKGLVISPFLHQSAIRRICEFTKQKPFLFSSRDELEKLPRSILEQVTSYFLSDLVVDGESHESADEPSIDAKKQNLHAKLFIFENSKKSIWLLGSANATEAAITRNIEFMIELSGASSSIRTKPRLRELIGEEEGIGPFIPFDLESGGLDSSEEGERQKQLRRFEYSLLKADIRGRLESSSSSQNMDLYIDVDLSGVQRLQNSCLSLKPFTAKQKFEAEILTPGMKQNLVFKNISELEISRFLQIFIEAPKGEIQHEFLIMIPIDGLPPDRLDNILKKVIDTEDKFFQYLGFLLDENPNKEDLLAHHQEENSKFTAEDESFIGFHLDLPIFERLLLASSRAPRKLTEVDEIIRRLEASNDDEASVIPAAFLSFWAPFRSVIEANQSSNKA